MTNNHELLVLEMLSQLLALKVRLELKIQLTFWTNPRYCEEKEVEEIVMDVTWSFMETKGTTGSTTN